MKLNRRAPVVLVTAFALALTGCTAAQDSPDPDASITMLNPEPAQGLDPVLAFADSSRVPMAMMFETLVERDENGEFVGSLASDWTVSDDGLTYTFTLRDDTAFSDGSAITAGDVVFSLERAQAGAVLGGALAGVSSIAADGDDTVVFTLDAPMSGLLTALATPGSAAILSQAAVEEAGDDYFTSPTVTSGPWSLDEYVPKGHATFVANEHYYNVPKIHTINYTFSEDQTAHAAAVESGTADIAGVGYPDAQRLKEESSSGITVVEVDQLAPLFWGWNQEAAPFDNKLVRQAVAWAVDREGRLDACWFGTGAVTYGNILRPWDPAYVELDTYKASRDEALENAADLLDEAGWVLEDGATVRTAEGVDGVADGTPLAFSVQYEGNWPAAECHVQVLQQNLAEVGFDATPESYDPAAYWGDVGAGKFTMYHGGASAIDAADLYFNWFSSGGGITALTTHLNDPEIDAMVDEARSASDPADAIAIYKELERWQAEELPMLVVGYQWPQTAFGPRVSGWSTRVDNDSRYLIPAAVTE